MSAGLAKARHFAINALDPNALPFSLPLQEMIKLVLVIRMLARQRWTVLNQITHGQGHALVVEFSRVLKISSTVHPAGVGVSSEICNVENIFVCHHGFGDGCYRNRYIL